MKRLQYISPIGNILISCAEDDSSINSIVFEETSEDSSQYNNNPLPEVLYEAKKELEAYFEGILTQFTFPIGQKGSDFQQQVWAALQAIPYGKTISYLALSRNIGNEKAIRAVGTTNGKNQLAIVVPCHRVIGSDGSLTGYAGGIWRKQWLLEHERKHSPNYAAQLGLF